VTKLPNGQLKLSGKEFADLSAEVIGTSASIRFRARGGSMSPFIRAGDVLTVDPVRPEEIGRGDVVLYRSAGGRALAHRVLGRRGHHYLIRGDGSAGKCEIVSCHEILGKVNRIDRDGALVPPRRTLALAWAATPALCRRSLVSIARSFRGLHRKIRTK